VTGLGSGIKSKIAVVTLGKASWIVVVALCAIGTLLLALTGYSGYSVVAAAVGISAAVQQAHKVTRNGGHITWIGNSARMIELDMQEVVARELSIAGTYGFQSEFPLALDAIASGRINVEPMMEKIAPLAEGPALIDGLAAGKLDLVKAILEL
jgi:threonine dehydrogenase-like Zn-dependent dehydrogenase